MKTHKESRVSDFDILRFIGSFSLANGVAPSYREIGNHVGISSTSVVNYHVTRLEKKGKVKFMYVGQRRAPRSIHVCV
jgi:SOS-response transcriptional repressor LexA